MKGVLATGVSPEVMNWACPTASILFPGPDLDERQESRKEDFFLSRGGNIPLYGPLQCVGAGRRAGRERSLERGSIRSMNGGCGQLWHVLLGHRDH